jgi:hypothetical protein
MTAKRELELYKALSEVYRRTGLLLHQSEGRMNRLVEHDRRILDVLQVNQEIALKALDD